MTSPPKLPRTQAEIRAQGNGYVVLLNNRIIKIASGEPLFIGSRALAEAIAKEWQSAESPSRLRFSNLPLTSLAGTQQGRVSLHRHEIRSAILTHAEADLLCYREEKAEVRQVQSALFDPIMAEFSRRTGVILGTTRGVMPLAVNPSYRNILAQWLEHCSDAGLTAVSVLVPAVKSVVLTRGLIEGWIDKCTALQVCHFEERWHMAHWGDDPELRKASERTAQDIQDVLTFLHLIRSDSSSACAPTEVT